MTPQQPDYQQVPMPPAEKKGPSCWAVGGIGCVVVILIFVILGFVAFQKIMHSKEGKDLIGTMQNAMQGAKEAVACEQKLQQIDGALVRYHEKNGSYPSSLSYLIPAYLPDPSVLKCDLPDADPTKSPFVYTKPTSSSSSTDKLVNFVWADKISMGGQTTTMRTDYYFTVGGKEMVQQATVDSTGRVTVMPAREKAATSPGT
jgi:hypothetical protein